jgi:Ca2+-binding EF-hand superfamily protein
VEALQKTGPKGSEALRKMQRSISATRDELVDMVKKAEEDSGWGGLQRKLGEAMMARGISPTALVKEWDKNGDGELSKIEFKQAVRLTLNLKASNDEIDEIFDSLDKNGDGTLDIDAEGERHASCPPRRPHCDARATHREPNACQPDSDRARVHPLCSAPRAQENL